MNLSPYVEALRRGLAAAAAAGTEETRRAAELLASAVEPSVRLALLEAISAAAAEVSDALADTTVEVRLRGQEPEVVVSTAEEPETAPPPVSDTDDALTRITLRIPETLKARVEQAAANEGVSVNAWLVQAVARGLYKPGQFRGRRSFTGYVRG